MQRSSGSRSDTWINTLGMAVVILFFLQALTSTIESIYMIDLLNTSIDEYGSGILFLLFSAWLGVGGWRNKDKSTRSAELTWGRIYQITGIAGVGFRLVFPFFDTKLQLLFAGLAVGCFFISFPLWLYLTSFAEQKTAGEWGAVNLGWGLGLGVLLSILFRTLHSTIDISLYQGFQAIGWGLAVFPLMTIGGSVRTCFPNSPGLKTPTADSRTSDKPTSHTPTPTDTTPPNTPTPNVPASPPPGFGFTVVRVVGVVNLLILVYFAFESPTVISRWTEGNYIAIITMLSGCLGGFMLIWIWKPHWVAKLLTNHILISWNVIFALSFVAMLLVHRVAFPATPQSPPVSVFSPRWFHQIPLYLMLGLSPVILVDFYSFTRQIIRSKPPLAHLAGAFTIAGAITIIVIFMFVFTNIWGYVGAVSLVFRNKFWLPFVLLLVGILTALLVGVPNTRGGSRSGLSSFPARVRTWQQWINHKRPAKIGGSVTILFIVLGSITAGVFSHPTLFTPPLDTTGLDQITVMTYNIQMGVNDTGSKNYDAQLAMIRRADADIIALQESDSAKLGGGNSDVVRYFAEHLGYYSYYGPKKVTGTYGTAFLSRFPIQHAESIFTYSDEDEIGTAYIQVQIGGRIIHCFNSHPDGSDEAKLTHIQTLMSRIAPLDYVISMGDFNSRPQSVYYNYSTAELVDTWKAVYPDGVGLGLNMSRRIDHIFVSPEFFVSDSTYVASPASQTDHPVYWTTLTF